MQFPDEETEMAFNCCGNSLLQLVSQVLESYCFEYEVQLIVKDVREHSCHLITDKDLNTESLEFLCEKVNAQFVRKKGESTCSFSLEVGLPVFRLLVTDASDLVNVT